MTRKMLMAVMLAAVLVATGCESEIDNKPAAKVTEVKKGDAKAEKKGDAKKDDAKKMAAGPAKTLQVDKAKSSIGFVGAKVTGDHKGDFKDLQNHYHDRRDSRRRIFKAWHDGSS